MLLTIFKKLDIINHMRSHEFNLLRETKIPGQSAPSYEGDKWDPRNLDP